MYTHAFLFCYLIFLTREAKASGSSNLWHWIGFVRRGRGKARNEIANHYEIMKLEDESLLFPLLHQQIHSYESHGFRALNSEII